MLCSLETVIEEFFSCSYRYLIRNIFFDHSITYSTDNSPNRNIGRGQLLNLGIYPIIILLFIFFILTPHFTKTLGSGHLVLARMGQENLAATLRNIAKLPGAYQNFQPTPFTQMKNSTLSSN